MIQENSGGFLSFLWLLDHPKELTWGSALIPCRSLIFCCIHRLRDRGGVIFVVSMNIGREYLSWLPIFLVLIFSQQDSEFMEICQHCLHFVATFHHGLRDALPWGRGRLPLVLVLRVGRPHILAWYEILLIMFIFYINTVALHTFINLLLTEILANVGMVLVQYHWYNYFYFHGSSFYIHKGKIMKTQCKRRAGFGWA